MAGLIPGSSPETAIRCGGCLNLERNTELAAGGFDPQPVFAVLAAVFYAIRHIAEQVDAEPARLALFERRRGIRWRRGRRVERPAIVDELGRTAFVVDIEAHAKPVRRRHLAEGVGD